MRSNIELAVAAVVAANQDVVVANVLTAYVGVAGFKHQSMEVITAFERALDKHPDSKDQVDSTSAKLVAGLRRDYWTNMFDWGGKQHCCSCCEEVVKQCIEDPDRLEEYLCKQFDAHSTATARAPRRKRRKPKNKLAPRKAIAFDPYSPSTSTSIMH